MTEVIHKKGKKSRQVGMQNDRQASKQKAIQTGKQASRKPGRQAGRLTVREDTMKGLRDGILY